MEIIGDAIEHCSVYLFPFIIEYSIIGSEVLFRFVSGLKSLLLLILTHKEWPRLR